MKTASIACLVAAALVAGHLRLTAAETARLRYLASVYADQKENGLTLPEGVACGGQGQFVVADTGNDRLLRFTLQDRVVTGGTEIKVPQLSAPSRVHLNSTGEIFALDSRQRRIVRLGPDGGFKAVLAPGGIPAPSTVVPKSFAIDAADNLYVLDAFSARVLVLDGQGQFKKALPLPDDIGFGSELAIDSAGAAIVIDSIKRRIFSAGRDAATFSQLGGDLTESLATLPTYITASRGIIFVVQSSGSGVVAFGRDGSFLSRQLTAGWDEGMLNHPSQLCINDKDQVFIADRDNSRVQVFQLAR
jgi:sugar lactone lactonase YvrE